MLIQYKKWLLNAPIIKKFRPLQVFIVLVILFIGIISVVSIHRINNSSQAIYLENITNRELISSIQEEILIIRIHLRDVIIENTEEEVQLAYDSMEQSFVALDSLMESLLARLSGDRRDKFKITMLEKEYYSVLIHQISDAIVIQNDLQLAVKLIDEVKPLSAQFYQKLTRFLDAEIKIMEDALYENEKSARTQYIYISLISLIGIALVFISIRYSVASIVTHVIGLSGEVYKIADSKNMKADIPVRYFTNDEIGFIAKVIQKLKKLLLEHSLKDFLTGGFNATAYRSDLEEFFESEKNSQKIKQFWIVIFDMNNLKHINDTFGHVAGDSAIRAAYNVLHNTFSSDGKVYRVGGDEFIAILQNSTAETIQNLLATMHENIAQVTQKDELKFSIASGYGEFVGTTQEEFEAFHTQIDMKMYENKDSMKANSRMNARVRN